MSSEDFVDSIKENLNGRPGQPIVLGVCSSLAKRFDQEPWLFRLAAIVLGVFYTGFALVAYIILGFVLDDTQERTRGVFQGLAITVQEFCEKAIDAVRDLFGHSTDRGNRTAR